MKLIMLGAHEQPANPDHDLRGMSVLDSNDRELGFVANLYVDEDGRHLRFIDVVPESWLGIERKNHHHLVPVQALISPAERDRRDMYGSIELQVDKKAVESSPTLPPHLPHPDPELQEAILKHYGYG